MEKETLTAGELELAKLLWEHGPISSRELVALCLERFRWQRTTTYTMLKRLENVGVARNENRTVQALVSREEYDQRQSVTFVEHAFGGSLPTFLAAFLRGKQLDEGEVRELKDLIDRYEGEGP